jgi:hypothetical protein
VIVVDLIETIRCGNGKRDRTVKSGKRSSKRGLFGNWSIVRGGRGPGLRIVSNSTFV